MATIEILIHQISIMFILMIVGYILFKIHLVDETGTQQFSDFILYIANPIIILQSLMTDYSYERLIKGVYAVFISVLLIIIGIVVSRLIYKKSQPLSQFAVIFSNVGFLGIPLIQNVLGNECVFYISIFSAVTSLFAWTYGMILITGSKQCINLKKVLMNPCVLMLIIGVLCFYFQLHLPEVMNDSLTAISNCNMGIVMIVLGLYSAQIDIKKVCKNKRIIFVCFLRLIVIPFITVCILSFLPSFLQDVKITMIIGSSTPVAALLVMLSHKFSNEIDTEGFSIGVVGISTIFSLITMPIFVALIQS